MKISIVKEFVKYAKVFISSEEPLPKAIEKYKLKIAPEKMHDVIYYSTLLFGESSTMAAEAACMGTPAIFIDHKGRGYTDELEHKYHLVYNFRISDNHIKHAIEKGVEILMQDEKKHEWSSKKNIMIYSHVNMVDFMVKLIGKKTN